MIRCRTDCDKECVGCEQPRKFVTNYNLYAHHSQVTPSGLAMMVAAHKDQNKPKQDLSITNWPFTIISVWIDTMTVLGDMMIKGVVCT